MNYIKNVFVFLLLSLSSLAALAMPSVADVETTIAGGDYVKAKEQLSEVLKANPDSYVANRYMLEIIKIENARDNVASVGYKIYEDKLAKIEKTKAEKEAAIKKAAEEKRIKERNAKFAAAMFWVFKVLFVLTVIAGIGYALLMVMRKHEAKKAYHREQQELTKWKGEIMPDLIDINTLLKTAMDDPKFDGTSTLLLFKDLHADNLDAIGCLDNDDYNQAAIKRHVKNAYDFLERNGITS